MNRPVNHTTEAQLYTGSVVRLTSLFHDDLAAIGRFEPVAADALPADYRTLLAHNDHMTVTLEAFHNGELGVTWVQSYVSEDKQTTFCVYDGPNPAAIRRAAERNNLTVERITKVSVLDPYFYR